MTLMTQTYLQKVREVASVSQVICMVASVAACMYFPVFISNCMEYTRNRRLERPDFPCESFEDFSMVLPYSYCAWTLKRLISRSCHSFFKSKLIKYQGEELDNKIKKCCKGLYKVVFFTFTFCLGYFMVLSETNFNPPIMFGSGNMMNVFSDYPYTKMPKYLKTHYMVSMSYYVEDLIVIVTSPPGNDYFEMILHHLLAIFLIIGSYMCGFWVIGIFVLVQMDICDIFVGLIRATMDYSKSLVTFVIWTGIISTFIYFRVLAYTYCVFWMCFSIIPRVDNSAPITPMALPIIMVLFIMNMYWIVLLLQMGIRCVSKGQAVDLQNIVTKKDQEFIDNDKGSDK